MSTYVDRLQLVVEPQLFQSDGDFDAVGVANAGTINMGGLLD